MDVIGASSAISTGFVPRQLQRDLRDQLKRFNVIVAHRRFGKTVFCCNHQLDKMARCGLPAPRTAYVAPTFGQAKRVSWDYYKLYGLKIPGAQAHEQDLRIDFPHNQGKQFLLSGENYATIKGIYLDDVVLDEYAEMDPSVWSEAVRPTLSDRRGCAMFIGTPRGRNNFHKLYEYATQSGDPEWAGFMYKASETGLIEQAELNSAKRSMSEDEYLQEYECDFNAGLMGAYFAKEMAKAEAEKRIASFPYDPAYAVDTYWDLGLDDATAVWFIQSKRGHHVAIDYYEVSGLSIPEVMADLKKKPYSLGIFHFPHDVVARDFSTGKSQQQIFQQHGARPSRVSPRGGTKREGINAARMIIPTTHFDRVKCEKGLKALIEYQRKWDTKNGVFQEAPLHNFASHGADAFQQFGLGQRGETRQSDFRDHQGYDQGYLNRSVSSYDIFGQVRK